MASIVGNATNTPNVGWYLSGPGGAAASKFTMPTPGGLITDLHGYFNTHNGSGAHGWLCVWDGGNGALLIASNAFIVNNSNAAPGQQQWWHQSLSNPVFIAGGRSLWIGFHCDQDLVFSSGSGGSSNVKLMGTGGPGSFGGSGGSGIGIVGAYAEYTPSGCHVQRGSSKVVGVVHVQRGAGKVLGVVHVQRGSGKVYGQ